MLMLEHEAGAKKRCSDRAGSWAAVRQSSTAQEPSPPGRLGAKADWKLAEQGGTACSRGRVFPCRAGTEGDSGCVELCRDLWSPQPSWSAHCHHVKKETKVAQAQGKPPSRSHSSNYAFSCLRCPECREMMQDLHLSSSPHPPGTVPATSTSQPVTQGCKGHCDTRDTVAQGLGCLFLPRSLLSLPK